MLVSIPAVADFDAGTRVLHHQQIPWALSIIENPDDGVKSTWLQLNRHELGLI